jgi:hypothetical protein
VQQFYDIISYFLPFFFQSMITSSDDHEQWRSFTKFSVQWSRAPMMITSNGGASPSSLSMIASSDDDREQWGSFTKFAGLKACKVGSIDGSFLFFFFFFGWVHIAKKLLIKCFLRISIARMHQNVRKKFLISLHMVQVANI